MKTTGEYFSLEMFIMLYEVAPTFESVEFSVGLFVYNFV